MNFIRMPHLKSALLLAALAAACGTATAAGQGYPKEMPPFGADKSIPPLALTRHKLANGLEVWVVPRAGAPRVSYVLALRDAGFAADAENAPGFAAMLATLLSAGTAQRDSRALAEEAQRLGGSIEAAASNDGITVGGSALASNADAMLRLLAEVVRGPTFPMGEVQLAKDNALQELKAAEAQPGFRADRALARATFGSHPYARTRATEAAIGAVSVAQLRAEHERRFRPEHALLVVSGRIDPAVAIAQAQAAFGPWRGQGQAAVDTPPAPTNAPVARLLLDRPGSVQATVRLGRPGQAAGSEDHVPLVLTSAILGAGFSSRVNMNLREDKGYTYGASARNRAFRMGGAITGGADVRNEVAGASLKEFFNEYQRIGTELVPEDELQMNKRYVTGSFVIGLERPAAVAQQLAGSWLVGQGPEYLNRFVAAIRDVRAEKVRELGAKFFAPQTQSVVVVGDRAALAEQLKPFGEFKAAQE